MGPAVRPILLAVALCTGWAASVVAQQATEDPAMEELRKRTPAGDNDRQTIDNWLEARFNEARNSPGSLREAVNSVRTAPDSTQPFRNELAERIGLFAEEKLSNANLAAPLATELMWTLRDIADARTRPGLAAGLAHSDSQVRYHAIKGLMEIRDQLITDPTQRSTLIATLRAAGMREENDVVAERIYITLKLPNPSPEVIEAFTAILTARIERYAAGATLGEAEVAAIAYLSETNLDRDQTASVVRQLAVLLRLDVEHYIAGLQGQFKTRQRDAIVRRIALTEEFIRSAVGPAAANAGNVVRAIADPLPTTDATIAAIRLQLNNWIGTPETEGALNRAPWNVPVGAPAAQQPAEEQP